MPIPVKTLPRYKCQYCLSYRAILKAVIRHEGFCYQNINRFCNNCNNTGIDPYYNSQEDYPEERYCTYCSKEDKELTKTLIENKQKG